MSDLKTNLQEILQEKQDKIIPENIKKDIQIFDIIGTYEGSGSSGNGVKLFETIDEMQADSTAKENDLAVVYRNEINNMTTDSQVQYITFPETVTLPEAFTRDTFCMLRAVDDSVMFDGQVMLNQSMFDFNGYTSTGMIRVEYSSADGITYNRTRFTGDSGDLTNPVDLGTVVKVYRSEEWNDNFGYFMQIEGMAFGGLYQAKEALDYNYIYGLGNIVSSNDITYTENTLVEVSNVIDTILENSELGISTLCFKMNNILYILKNMNRLYNIVGEIGFRLQSQYGNSEQNIECATVNMDTLEVTQSPLAIDTNYASINGDNKWYMSLEVFNNIDYAFILYEDSNGKIHTSNIDIRTLENNTLNYTTVVDFTCYFKPFIVYKLANNQFTLTSPNQLLPNISAYGKNGNITGDGSIYDNLDMNVRWKLLSGDKLLTENLNDWTFIGMTGSNSITAGDVVSPQSEENYYCAQIKQENIFEEGFDAKFTEILGESYVQHQAQFVGIYNNQLYFLCLCATTENSKYSVKLVRFNLDYSLADVNEIIQFNTTAPSVYSMFSVATDYSTVLFSTTLEESNTKVYLFDVNTLECANIGNMSTSFSVEGMLTRGDYCYVLTRTGVGRINLATKTYEQSYMTFNEAKGFVFKLETDSYLYFGYETADYTLSIVECIEKKIYSYADIMYPSLNNTVVDNEVNAAYIYKRNNNSTTTILEVSETGIEEVTYTNKGKMSIDYSSNGYWFKDNNNLVLVPFTRPGLAPYFLVLNPASKTITYGLLTYNYDAGEYYKNTGFNGGSYSTNPKNIKIEIINDCIKYTHYASMVNIFILLYKNCSLQRGVLSNTVTTGFACNDSDSGIVLKTLTSKDITDVFNPVDYTNTISPNEYITALDTSKQILGEEETINE